MRRIIPVLAALVLAGPAWADIKPHPLIADGMVLQRDMRCPIWGTAEPGEEFTWQFDLKENEGVVTGIGGNVKADKDGRWQFTLPELKAGAGPHRLTLTGKTAVAIKDIQVGEVWVCSGQSNMEWSLAQSADPQKHSSAATDAKLRLFTVPRARSKEPARDVKGKWVECSPEAALKFSAVAYFFGRDLRKALKVPIGLIHTSWGGTPAEDWTPKSYLEKDEQLKGLLSKQSSSTIYNGMIASIQPYGIKGAIWYQGESNADRAYQYRTLFPTMIKSWRDTWKQGEFPFLFVQLAPFKAIADQPQESDWAELREAQLLTAQNLRNTAMAVITDAGDPRDIHPKQKEPVGARLAIAARALAYGEKIEHSGPIYDKLQIDANKAVLSFKHVGKGLESKDGDLKGFAVAGEDRKFYWAKAEIQGDKVIVTCDKVEKPVAVRYGWANCPVVNLWNKDGLPASPFRTDDFPMQTKK